MRALFSIWISMLVGLGLLSFGSQMDAPVPNPTIPLPSTTTPVVPHVEELVTDAAPRYRVIKVVDGDTVVVQKGGTNVTLRLIGMDAPETTTLRKGVVECFGDRATERARELLDNISIALETDMSQDTLDKYGRTLAYIFLPDGRNFAKTMIAEGYAHEYTYRLPYKYQKEFRAAQTSAEENRRGLWSSDACRAMQVQTAAPAQSAGAAAAYDCSKNIYNCSSFKNQSEAQTAFDSCGGSSNDIHKLDSDGDGKVCEGLP